MACILIENDFERLGRKTLLFDEITYKSPNNSKSHLLNKKILIKNTRKNTENTVMEKYLNKNTCKYVLLKRLYI